MRKNYHDKKRYFILIEYDMSDRSVVLSPIGKLRSTLWSTRKQISYNKKERKIGKVNPNLF